MSFKFVAAVTALCDFGAQENKLYHCFYCFPIYLPWSDGTGCHDLSFFNVELCLESYIKTNVGEQNGGGVGEREVYLSPWIPQEYPSDTEVHAEHQLRPDRSTWPVEKNI